MSKKAKVSLTEFTSNATCFELSRFQKAKGDSHLVLCHSASGSSISNSHPCPHIGSRTLMSFPPPLRLPTLCQNSWIFRSRELVLTSFSSQGGYLSKGNFQESCISGWVSCHHSHYLMLNWAGFRKLKSVKQLRLTGLELEIAEGLAMFPQLVPSLCLFILSGEEDSVVFKYPI